MHRIRPLTNSLSLLLLAFFADVVRILSSLVQTRTALIAEIAEAAILEFINCPFSSLVGHMDFDPACRIELTPEEHEIVRDAARAKGLSLEDFMLQSLGLPLRARE